MILKNIAGLLPILSDSTYISVWIWIQLKLIATFVGIS